MLGISYEGATAVITTVGAGLRSFEVDGVPYVETFGADEKPPMSAGAVLVPWPNRTAGACWTLDGVRQQLEVTEPARGNAIHGLVRRRPWAVLEHTGSLVSLETTVEPQAGWPAALHVTVSYALDDRGLTVTHGVTNVGDVATPFGVGTHPYPRAGNASTDECTLDSGRHDGAAAEQREDGAFRRCRAGGGHRVRLPAGAGAARASTWTRRSAGASRARTGWCTTRSPRENGGVEVWADPVFRWVQVYTPDSYPGPGPGRGDRADDVSAGRAELRHRPDLGGARVSRGVRGGGFSRCS